MPLNIQWKHLSSNHYALSPPQNIPWRLSWISQSALRKVLNIHILYNRKPQKTGPLQKASLNFQTDRPILNHIPAGNFCIQWLHRSGTRDSGLWTLSETPRCVQTCPTNKICAGQKSCARDFTTIVARHLIIFFISLLLKGLFLDSEEFSNLRPWH